MSDQAAVAQAMVSIGEKLGAPIVSILACLNIGAGENSWTIHGCNASNHCGIFQLSSSLQAQHSYTDYVYWTYRAYQTGFWRASLIGGARANPSIGAGYLANLCQGAYSDLAQGAAYYGQFDHASSQLYNQYKGSSAPSAPSSGGVVTPSGQAISNVGLPGLEDAIDTSSALVTMFPGAGDAAGRAHQGYQASHDTWYRIRGLSVFTKNGGR